jgi:hypothetical protein
VLVSSGEYRARSVARIVVVEIGNEHRRRTVCVVTVFDG